MDEQTAQALKTFKDSGIKFTLSDDRLAANGPSAKDHLDLIKEYRGPLIVQAMCDRYELRLADVMDFIGIDMDLMATATADYANTFGRMLQQQKRELMIGDG